MPPGEACPAKWDYDIDMATGIKCASLPANLRARLEVAKAASRAAAREHPCAPYPPRHE